MILDLILITRRISGYIRPGLFVTDISKTYVSLAKKVMSTTLMENQAIKTNWGVVWRWQIVGLGVFAEVGGFG